VIPVSSAAGAANGDGTSPSVTRNVVRGVNPPSQIWVTPICALKSRLTGVSESRARGCCWGAATQSAATAGRVCLQH
jgi:hypothetical protein